VTRKEDKTMSMSKQEILEAVPSAYLVTAAMQIVEQTGVPTERHSHNWCIAFNGRHFAPKYLLSLAGGLDAEQFKGGENTANDALRDLGFAATPCHCGGRGQPHTEDTRAPVGVP
jgi:hypothetical protein